MSSIIYAPKVSIKGPVKEIWTKVGPYASQPIAASIAIVPVFRDLIAKSSLQKGEKVLPITIKEGMRQGLKAAPTVGAIVGSQMLIQNVVEKALLGKSKTKSLSTTFESSAIVGAISAPVLAVFNGQTMGWSVLESLKKFSGKQALAITIQETAFVAGISASDQLSKKMKNKFGDNKAVEYGSTFLSGAAGSLVGHPANTALTRWQSKMRVDSSGQLMWGSIRKARAIGLFAVLLKFGKECLSYKA